MHIIYYLIILISFPSYADITLDGSLGTSGGLTGPDYKIKANYGKQADNNLFHSFGEFNIYEGESATFTGPEQITNIIGRVTGNNQSFIDGFLNSTISNANLYLMNPNGVIIGPNAELNIDGAFHLSSTDYLQFADGQKFETNTQNPPLLTTATPEQFGFLDKISDIQIINIDLEHKGFFITSKNLQIIASDIYSDDNQAGDIHLKANESLEILGSNIISSPDTNGNSGNIILDSKTIIVDNRFEIQGTKYEIDTFIGTKTSTTSNAGNININASQKLIVNNSAIVAQTNASGNAGYININVGNLTLQNGGRINASSGYKASGNAGNIYVNVTNSAIITGQSSELINEDTQPSAIGSSAFNIGNSGSIHVTAQTINLDKHGTIQTLARGQGKAGDIKININDLTIKQGADIDASNEGTGSEKGGNITINATGTIFITAEYGEDEFKTIVNEGYLGGIYSVADNNGIGGDVILTTKNLELRGGGTISAGSKGLGNAGKLHLQIENELNMDNAAIITRSIQSGGGDIKIAIPNEIHLNNSNISAEAKGSKPQDKGGNITIQAQSIFSINNSQLLADAYAGNGGNLDIKTKELRFAGDSKINISSELGLNGSFVLNSIKLKDNFLLLPPSKFGNAQLSLSRCSNFSKENLSSFIITSRDVSPSSPEDLFR